MRVVHGDQDVLPDLLRTLKLLARGTYVGEEVRIGLFGGPGLLRGINGAGYLWAMQMAGLLSAFVAVGGVSTTIPAIAYSLALQAELVVRIYWHDCTSVGFYILGEKPPMKVEYLNRIFQETLKFGPLRASRPKFDAVLRNIGTGRLEFFDMKHPQLSNEDVVAAMCAGIAVPKVSCGQVEVGGILYGDAYTELPLEEFVERHRLTHLLVFLNEDIPQKWDTTWNEKVQREIDLALSRSDCKTVIIAGRNDSIPIKPLDRRSEQLRAAAIDARDFFADLLRKA